MGSRLARGLPCLAVVVMMCLAAQTASAQSFRVQCPQATITHPNASANNAEPAYNGPTVFGSVPVVGTTGGYVTPTSNINGAIKCQQISGGDGLSTMGDGTQIYMFSFGPLSGLADIAAGLPGTQFPNTFNVQYPGTLVRGDPAATDGAMDGSTPGVAVPESAAAFIWNGAVGLTPDIANIVTITNILADGSTYCGPSNGARACGTSAACAFMANTFEGLPLPTDLSVPGAVYCAAADCTAQAGLFATATAKPSSSSASTGQAEVAKLPIDFSGFFLRKYKSPV